MNRGPVRVPPARRPGGAGAAAADRPQPGVDSDSKLESVPAVEPSRVWTPEEAVGWRQRWFRTKAERAALAYYLEDASLMSDHEAGDHSDAMDTDHTGTHDPASMPQSPEELPVPGSETSHQHTTYVWCDLL